MLFYLNLINASNFTLFAKPSLILYWSLLNIFLKCSKKYCSKISVFGNRLEGKKKKLVLKSYISLQKLNTFGLIASLLQSSMTHYSLK